MSERILTLATFTLFIAVVGAASSCSSPENVSDPGAGDQNATAARISGCTGKVSVPSREWVGVGDNAHWSATGTATETCSSPQDLLLTVELQVWNGSQWTAFTSRSQDQTHARTATFTPLMGCPSGPHTVRYRFTVNDTTTGATMTVFSSAVSLYC
jgi:hypothetical protein